MKVRLIVVGKTSSALLKDLEKIYEQRLMHYLSYERIELSDIKQASSSSPQVLKEKEGQLILSKVADDQKLILLDEQGMQMSSVGFSDLISKHFLHQSQMLVFCIGGAYGFSNEVYARANVKLALSKMTFSHQMVRTIFLEQLYRACTIIRGEKYHHS